MRSRLWLIAPLFLLLFPLAACRPPLATATVTEVIDGDTIVIATGQRVRYIGIDAPEIYPQAERFGQEAWSLNAALVSGKKVTLERDVSRTDQYGRLLRYVYVDNLFVNAELVRRGLARARAYPPDTRYQASLQGLEDVARESGRGMWAK
ncbi:MAG: thermonuclease family protein [Chloroflexota bacterium]